MLDFQKMAESMVSRLPAESGTEAPDPTPTTESTPSTQEQQAPATEPAPTAETKQEAMVPSHRLREATQRARAFEAQHKTTSAELTELKQKYAELERRAQTARPETPAATAPSEATDQEWLDKLLQGRDPDDLTVKEITILRKEMKEFRAWKESVDPRLGNAENFQKGLTEQRDDARLETVLEGLKKDVPGVHEDVFTDLLIAGRTPEEIVSMFPQVKPKTTTTPAAPVKPAAVALPRIGSQAAPTAQGGDPYKGMTFFQKTAAMKKAARGR